MSGTSLHASEELEKGSTDSALKNGATEVRSIAVNPEYSRYLDLHAQFEGDARRRLLRKRAYYCPTLHYRASH